MLAWLEKCLHFTDDQEIICDSSTTQRKQVWDVQAPYYFVCESQTICWKCRQETSVYAISLPKNAVTVKRVQEMKSTILTYVT